MKKKLVNAETKKSVSAFINNVTNKQRKEDSKTLVTVMQKITGKKPRIWGTGIVGFGKYSYKRKSGDEFEWFVVGFSPGKANLTVYVMYDINKEKELLKKLGKHKTGKGCLYLNRLEDVNMSVLKKLIAKSKRWRF